MLPSSLLFLLADPHWNHEKLTTIGDRPQGFTQLMVQNCRKMIRPQDMLVILGDVIVGRQSELGDYLAQIPGTKILIRGNHDMESYGWYLRKGFAAVMEGMLYDRVWLTHFPQMTLPDGALLNVHGHLHAPNHHPDCTVYPHCKLLAVENTNYCPVEFKQFVGPLQGDCFSFGEGHKYREGLLT